MQLHLVRHGETDWNKARRIQGTVDIDLNETGQSQAAALGASLRGELPFSGLYTSTLRRARSTAVILGSILETEAVEVPGLHEMDFGVWQGLTWPEVEARYPLEFASWLGHRRTTRTPGGESYDDLLARVVRSLAALADSAAAGDLLVVTHGAVILSLRCLRAGTDFAAMDSLKVSNLERFVVDAGEVQSWVRLLR